MKDASDVVEAIKVAVSGSKMLCDTIGAYEDEMRARGAKEVALSLEQAEKSRDFATLMESPIFKLGHDRSQPLDPPKSSQL